MYNTFPSGFYSNIPSYSSTIGTNQYRVVLRVGYIDVNNNGSFDYKNGETWDYHWWYQTSTGQWAEKNGSSGRSQLIPGTSVTTNPANVVWEVDLGTDILYYNSSCIYYAIKN